MGVKGLGRQNGLDRKSSHSTGRNRLEGHFAGVVVETNLELVETLPCVPRRLNPTPSRSEKPIGAVILYTADLDRRSLN